MSKTHVLYGEDSDSVAEKVVDIIRGERSVDGTLSRAEHDILSGLEDELLAHGEQCLSGDELSGPFLAVLQKIAAKVGPKIANAVKSGALEKVANFIGKAKETFAKKKDASGNATAEDAAAYQALSNIQTSAKTTSKRLGMPAVKNQMSAIRVLAAKKPQSRNIAMSPSQEPQKDNTGLLIGAALIGAFILMQKHPARRR
jgi:hypothetical protein